MSSRNYYGCDLKVINSKCVSKYTAKKLMLTKCWGFVKVVEEKLDKVVVDVFYLDFSFAHAPINFVSREIVEKKDISLLDWNMVRYMYNMGIPYIVENYLRYMEVFDTYSIGYSWNHNEKWCISYYDKEEILKEYDDFFTLHSEGRAWMFDQIESGKIDIVEHIKKLKAKYKL